MSWTLERLLALNPDDFKGRDLLEEMILEWLRACDAYWIHDGDPINPHAELSSGMCSNGFVYTKNALQHPNLAQILAAQLARKVQMQLAIEGFLFTPKIDVVIAEDTPEGTLIAKYMAAALGAEHMLVERLPTTKKGQAGKKRVWSGAIPESKKFVLQVTELMTTAKTIEEVRRAVNEGNETPVSWVHDVGVATLIHRPPQLPAPLPETFGDTRIVSLIEREVWAVDPQDCPLCKQGSKRLQPKNPESNWAKLTGRA